MDSPFLLSLPISIQQPQGNHPLLMCVKKERDNDINRHKNEKTENEANKWESTTDKKRICLFIPKKETGGQIAWFLFDFEG